MKKLFLVLGMVACIFGMTALSQETVYASGSAEPISAEEAFSNAEGFAGQLNDIVTSGMVEQYLGYDEIYNALVSFENALEVMGTYQGIISAEGTVDGAIITINAVVDGSERDADMVIILNHEESAVVSITTEAQKTFGELMTNAALNTLLGMGTVFIVLILIAWIISMFKYINVLGSKKTEKPAPAPAAAPAPVPAAAPVEEAAEEDDLELIAVIAAAIAASEGAESTDGFVVRSIKRRGSKWQKA